MKKKKTIVTTTTRSTQNKRQNITFLSIVCHECQHYRNNVTKTKQNKNALRSKNIFDSIQ